jgi:ubiquinone/menaquinone biosynthesis C-methylase UbiE
MEAIRADFPRGAMADHGEPDMTEQHPVNAYGGTPPENYERFFVPAIGAPLAADLVRAAALRPGERILDVACGTGVVARLAAREVGAGGSVAGLDVNPGMLGVARSAAPPDVRIEWHEASCEAMPFPDESFDVVLCQMGLQFMPDKQSALREMRRVLAGGGRLVFNVPGPMPRLLSIMAEAFENHIGAEPAMFVKQVFSLHDTAEIENLLKDAGLRDVSVQAGTRSLQLPAPEDFLWQYVHSTPLAGIVTQLDDERRASLQSDVVAKWQEFVEDRALMLQLRNVVAIARK